MQSRIPYLLGFHYFVAIALSIGYLGLYDQGEVAEYVLYYAIQYWPVTIASTFGYCAVKKKSANVELLGSVVFVVYLSMMSISLFSGLLTVNLYYSNAQFMLLMFYYFLYAGLLTTTFKWHLVARVS